MKHYEEAVPQATAASFNTLCGSSANEATKQFGYRTTLDTFNTLCGSSANEATQAPLTSCRMFTFQYPLRVVSQ